MTRPRPAVWAFALLVAGTGTEANASSGAPSIIMGNEANECDFPSAVALLRGDATGPILLCSAVLVHPRLILTAGHCLEDGVDVHSQVEFGESLELPGASNAPSQTIVPIERCQTHPDYDSRTLNADLGFCVLAEDAPPVPIIPPLMGCETEALEPGRQLAEVGFGRAFQNSTNGRGIKRWDVQTIEPYDYLTNNIVLAPDGSGSCVGDSGGPSFLQLEDGSWRLAGIISSAYPEPPYTCGQGNVHEVVHTLVEWVEEHSGLDITPCHDGDGTWNPDESCDALPLNPLADEGAAWADACATAQISARPETCGDPWMPEDGTSSSGGDDPSDGDSTNADDDPSSSEGTDGPATTTEPDRDDTGSDGTGSGGAKADSDGSGCRVGWGASGGYSAGLLLLIVGRMRKLRTRFDGENDSTGPS